MLVTPTITNGNGVTIPSTITTIQPSETSRIAIIDLFNLYLGVTRNDCRKADDSINEPPNKIQKRIAALNLDIPPDAQFFPDFEQLLDQFHDREQLRSVVESVVVSFVIQLSNHGPRSQFILFAIRKLYSMGYIYWDSFLPSLLSSATSAEMSVNIPSVTSAVGPASPNPNVQSPNPESCTVSVISGLCKLSCQIIISAMETNLKASTHADIFHHMLSWLVNWDQRQQRSDEVLFDWLHKCLSVVRMLVDDNKYHVPFYELLRSRLLFLENLPDDVALFTLVFEVHRRRDLMGVYMKMLDQHLHCPTFGNQRLLNQTAINMLSESVTGQRYSPITYPSVLGEPLHGEDIAFSIQGGSLDWERAIRCLKHAIRSTPSPDWWRRVLNIAPCYRSHSQGPIPGSVFSSEMICEAIIDRIIELLKLTNSDVDCWQEWLIFSDVFFFLMKSGCMDFVDFVGKLVLRLGDKDHQILRTNHVTWLLAQIIRVEVVVTALNTDSRKAESTRKVLSFHKEDRSQDPNNPQSILLDFICSCQTLRIWSLNLSNRECLNNEQLEKGKKIDEWWRKVSKGEYMMDYMNLDDKSIGMFWVVSHTMAQPACELVMSWLTCDGYTELPEPNPQVNGTITVRGEVKPVPISLLSGFSINLCLKLAFQMEDNMFSGVHAPNIAMVETYTRLLLIHPHALFRSLLSNLHQRSPETSNKPGATLLVLEILNYRLFSLYRYHGKNKTLMYDITKILSILKGKRGEHRIFRLAENLCMNLIMSLREFFFVKKEGKGPSDFTETLNRVTVTTLAIIIKTRGISDAEHLLYLQTILEQILATSTHTWSDKTLRYFPAVLRDVLIGRIDKRALAIQAWQQAEATVIKQCTQLLSPPDDPTYVRTYISHSFPQHRQYLCAGAWVLMRGHPENINTGNLGRVLREFSPEEVTANVYTMVDVLLHNIQLELQHGHSLQDIISNACDNLAHFIWKHELLPPDILLLALIDRDDDPYALRIVINLLERQELQQRIKFYIANRGKPEHWLQTETFTRVELQKALGNHLSWKESNKLWSDKTLRYFPAVLRDVLIGRIDKRALAIQAWQQAEATVIKQCTQLLSPPDDPTYVRTYISHSFPQHRQYLCAGAWVLMRGHPENINTGNLGRVLREFSPEEVTANVYTMVDVLLHNIQLELQHGHSLQDIISNACDNLAHFIWKHELLPPDILLLALIDRDDDPYALRIVINLLERQELQQRIKFYIANRGKPEHWLQTETFTRVELQKALGNHLSWKERYPTYFDDIAARLLPVIPLIIYRLIENDAIDAADRVLQMFSSFLHYYPLTFTFVRDILAYFYGHLPAKLILRILNLLDVNKIPSSMSFPQYADLSNATSPPLEYFTFVLLGLVNNVIPPLCNSKDVGQNRNNSPTTNQSGSPNAFDGQKAFYQTQDPGTYTQLVLETTVIKILSLPVTATQIVSAFVQIIVKIQPNGSENNYSDFVTRTGYSYQQLSCVLIQACGLLLAQLPVEFHIQLYSEASRVIKDCSLHSNVGYVLLDPTLAMQENTSTALGNMVALLHALFSNLPQEWLEKTHLLVNQLRPISSVTVLKIVFRIIGPLLPRLVNAHTFFMKTLELLLSMMIDVFGSNTQPSVPVEASEIADLIDFLHHVVHYDGQGGAVTPTSKPRPDVLALCGKAIENMRSDVQHLLSHLKTDPNRSIYAATHPKLFPNPS